MKSEFEKRYTKIRLQRAKREQLVGKLIAMRTNLVHKHLSGIYTDEVFYEQNTLLSANIDRLKVSTNIASLQKYTLVTCEEYIDSQLVNLYETYTHLSADNRKAILSTMFPHGFTWHYPGLTFSKINPLFKV